jgi:hypothetical protein
MLDVVGNRWEIDIPMVGHDSVSFPVVDRLEAKSNDRPGPKCYDLPDTDKTRRLTRNIVRINPQSPS